MPSPPARHKRNGFKAGPGRWMVLCLVLCVLVPAAGGRVLPGGNQEPVVVLDPGHGGNDRGVAGEAGMLEKDVCLALAKKIRAALEGRVRVILTRTDDYGLSIAQRTSLANHQGADVFVSLHAGGGFRRAVNRQCIYYWLPVETGGRAGPGPEAGGGRPLDWDRVQERHIGASARLAREIRSGLEEIQTPVDTDVIQAPLAVLKGAGMPAVVFEAGYLTHPKMAGQFDDPAYLDRLARAVAEGIRDFLDQPE